MADLTNLTLGTATPKLLNVNTALTSGDVEITDGAGNGSNLYIDGTNLGIGKSAPTSLLHMSGATDIPITLESTDTACGIDLRDNVGGSGGVTSFTGMYVNQTDLRFKINNVIKMTIKNDGKVGIGAGVSPSHQLEVAGGAKMGSTSATADYNAHTIILSDSGTAYEGGLLMTNVDTASAGNSSIKINSTSSGGSGTSDLHIGVVDNNAPNTFIRQHMHLDGATGNVNFLAGNVGIGIGSATAKLHIDQSSASGAMPVLRLDQGDTDESFIDFIGTSTDNDASSISELNGTFPNHEAVGDGWVRVEVNGVHRWIPTFVAPV